MNKRQRKKYAQGRNRASKIIARNMHAWWKNFHRSVVWTNSYAFYIGKSFYVTADAGLDELTRLSEEMGLYDMEDQHDEEGEHAST